MNFQFKVHGNVPDRAERTGGLQTGRVRGVALRDAPGLREWPILNGVATSPMQKERRKERNV